MWSFCYVTNEKLVCTTIAQPDSLSAKCVCVSELDCLSLKLQWPELWLWEGEGGRADVSNGIFLKNKLFLWSTLNFQSLNWVCAPHTGLLVFVGADPLRHGQIAWCLFHLGTNRTHTVGEEGLRRFISFNDDKLCISYFTFLLCFVLCLGRFSWFEYISLYFPRVYYTLALPGWP